jgi:hypothetical protein
MSAANEMRSHENPGSEFPLTRAFYNHSVSGAPAQNMLKRRLRTRKRKKGLPIK